MRRQRQWLEHTATEEQLCFFRDNGNLVVPDAIRPPLLRRLVEVTDRVAEAARAHHGLKRAATHSETDFDAKSHCEQGKQHCGVWWCSTTTPAPPKVISTSKISFLMSVI